MKLGEFIHNYRVENKLTMQDFANRSGLSKGYISMLEKNQHPQSRRQLTPSLETYQKIAIAANLSLDELISVLDGNEMVSLYSDTASESGESYSITSDIVALLQSESVEIQQDALALMECFVSCDTYSKGRLLAYAQGLNHSSIDNDYEEIRQEVIKAREERKRKGREQLEDCAPVKESV
ncbi:helix-turn-helix transcriptional regulator [Emergencia sp. JLR.KK010]|uniref:helix-turn-helix domain-containing protein n=1 Tax=Emergencia sp. JLR.KK010 TaxID=3114296 RepID=UPI0030D17A4D